VVVDAITYVPFGTWVGQLAHRLAVEGKVYLVGHSPAGVVIAQAIASGRRTGQIDTVVTFGVTGHVFALEQLAASWSIGQLRDVGGFDSLHLVHFVAKVT